jgi:hypothetical protein
VAALDSPCEYAALMRWASAAASSCCTRAHRVLAHDLAQALRVGLAGRAPQRQVAAVVFQQQLAGARKGVGQRVAHQAP